jgi:hypothetical protein
VLAKHTKHFSPVDLLSNGIGGIQRNFEPVKEHVEAWKATRVPGEAAKLGSSGGVSQHVGFGDSGSCDEGTQARFETALPETWSQTRKGPQWATTRHFGERGLASRKLAMPVSTREVRAGGLASPFYAIRRSVPRGDETSRALLMAAPIPGKFSGWWSAQSNFQTRVRLYRASYCTLASDSH